jgi:hypothetical protein
MDIPVKIRHLLRDNSRVWTAGILIAPELRQMSSLEKGVSLATM